MIDPSSQYILKWFFLTPNHLLHPVVIFRLGCLIVIFQPFGNFLEKSVDPLRSSLNDPKTSLNQQISLLGEFLTHFDIYNLSVALKLKRKLWFKGKRRFRVWPSSAQLVLLSKPQLNHNTTPRQPNTIQRELGLTRLLVCTTTTYHPTPPPKLSFQPQSNTGQF